MSAELPAGRRRHGNSQGATGIPKAGQQEGKDELPQIWPSPLLALPRAPRSLAGPRGRAGPPEQTGKGRGLARMNGVPRPTNKRHGFCSRCSRSVWHARRGRCPPPGRWPGLLATRSRRRTREQAGGVGAGARGLTQPEARHACSVPHFPGRAGDPAPGGGGRSAHAAAPTGAGSAAAASLSAGALPEPGLACAAAPRRWP